MAREATRTRAVLFDALGTLVRLEPPAPRLRAELRRAGVEVSQMAAERAFRAEIAYYLAHHAEGRDVLSLAALRERCAAILARELALDGIEPDAVREAMLASLEFTPYEDSAPTLRELRERETTAVVASNWDCSLPEVLDRSGLLPLVEGVVSSAQTGRPKPAPEVFRAALELAGAAPEEALHVGDSLEKDVEGANRAGLRAVLLVRAGKPPAGVPAVRSLAEVPGLI